MSTKKPTKKTETKPAKSQKLNIKAKDLVYFDHKDYKNLQKFMNNFGQIESRYKSAYTRSKPALKESQQKRLSRAIKRARHLALLPFVKKDY